MKLTDKIDLLQVDFELVLSPEKKLTRFVNVVLIFGEKITLIDTGVSGSEDKIFEYIAQNNRTYSDIKTVILSHSHPDHIGAAKRIKEMTNCEILAHKNELGWIENIDNQYRERPVPGFYSLVEHSVKIDSLLNNNQELDVAEGITLKTIHTPGHSKGSLNFLFKEDKILFTADSIPLKNDIPNYDSFPELLKSLETIRANDKYNLLLTSWTPPLYNYNEIRKLLHDGEKYILKIDRIVNQIYEGIEPEPLMFCRMTLERLDLPPFLVSPIVDKAFRSHLM